MEELRAIDWASQIDWRGELAEFITTGDRSEKYIRSRLSYLWSLGERYGVPYSQLAKRQVAMWMNGVRDAGLNGDRTEPLAPTSQHGVFAVVKCILRYFDNEAAFKGLKYGYIESRTGENGDANLTAEESLSIAERLQSHPWSKTAWVLIRAAALRPGEATRLKVGDVRVIEWNGTPALEIHVTDQKNKKKGSWDRMAYTDEHTAIKEFEYWLRVNLPFLLSP